MLFNSPVYICLFLPLVFIGYFALNRQRLILAGKAWLVLTSLFFYAYWKPDNLIIIMSSMLINYALGTILHKAKQLTGRKKRINLNLLLISGIVFNLGLIAYYKYGDFLIENINQVLKNDFPLPGITLPLAISFFTFQQIAYLIDCYRYNSEEYDFLNYCLFVTFFPQLIAGPIVHHREMMPQFSSLRQKKLNWNNISTGIFIFSMGLFKKVIIADTFAIWANIGFDGKTTLDFWHAWGTSLSYTFQLYYDFSGYTDMAIGAALLFNIRLPINFNSPYKALTIQDFWRRWHMTLSRWFRDYCYIPLGGNRRTATRTYINVLITFLLVGLWHGAGWTFIVWGGLHGLAMICCRLWQRKGFPLPTLLAWLLTFLFVNTAWVFFRATSFSKGMEIVKGMVNFQNLAIPIELWKTFLQPHIPILPQLTTAHSTFSGLIQTEWLIFFTTLTLFSANTIQVSRFISYSENHVLSRLRLHYSLPWAIITGLALAMSLQKILYSPSKEFIYFNF